MNRRRIAGSALAACVAAAGLTVAAPAPRAEAHSMPVNCTTGKVRHGWWTATYIGHTNQWVRGRYVHYHWYKHESLMSISRHYDRVDCTWARGHR